MLNSKLTTHYSTAPLTIGKFTSFTRPLIRELFDKGNGVEVCKLLFFAHIKIEADSSKQGFKLYKIDNIKNQSFMK